MASAGTAGDGALGPPSYPTLEHIMTLSLPRRLLAAGLLSLAVAATAAAFDPKSTSPVNVDQTGVALRGHDPVAYFTGGKPTPGAATFQSKFDGATYQFSSAANKDMFDKEPAKFAPQYGGFCAFAAAKGAKFDADPSVFKVVDGKLYMNFNADVSSKWNADVPGHIKAANTNWPGLKDKAPKP
jgi:YHS domain-containing protein